MHTKMNISLAIKPEEATRLSSLAEAGQVEIVSVRSEKSVTTQELARLLAEEKGVELLDVRTPGEYGMAHVPGARLIPVDDLNASSLLSQRRSEDKPIYVICQTTRRARNAIRKFQQADFDGCILVEGGMQAWLEAGLPVDRAAVKALPLMRQVQIVVGLASAIGAALALTVNPFFALLPLFIGCGLLFAGLTGVCGLALVLAKMPWNRLNKCRYGSTCQTGG